MLGYDSIDLEIAHIDQRRSMLKFLIALKRIVFFFVFFVFAAASFFATYVTFGLADFAKFARGDFFFILLSIITLILFCAGLYFLRNAFRSLFPKK